MLSIIIPTLNEENHLLLLLKSIKKQAGSDPAILEIIVADAGSTDRTVKIAENYGCKIVSGGLPAAGRNNGAKIAKGDLLLFLDADTILPENSLERFLSEFRERNLDIASFFLKSPQKFHNLSYKIFYNFLSFLTEKFLPQAMCAVLVKKTLHQKINGFDKEIKIGEDLDYVRRGAKIGKFGVLRASKIFASPRRFQKDGWFLTWLKYFLCQVHMLFLGPVKSDILRYRFGHYHQDKKFYEIFKLQKTAK